MSKHRLASSKAGTAEFISHLDLMHTFQRPFLRAGIAIKHIKGFNLHASAPTPLPLSVGFSSGCEVPEYQVLDTPLDQMSAKTNAALPTGIIIQRCYEAVRLVKEPCYVNYIIILEYEAGALFGAESAIRDLLAWDCLVMTKRNKKAKNGFTEADLIPLITRVITEEWRDAVTLDPMLRTQNLGLNPELVVVAIREYCPDAISDLVTFRHRAMLDGQSQTWEQEAVNKARGI